MPNQHSRYRAHTLTNISSDFGPVITLTVDDCWKTHAHAFDQAFLSMSLRGVFYVVAGFFGGEGNGFLFFVLVDLRQMSFVGEEIGSHSFSHRRTKAWLTTKG